MKIEIKSFQVIETYISRPRIVRILDWLLGGNELDKYHFDTRIRIGELPNKLELKINDIIQLDNAVKLMVWSIDRGNMIKAKTFMMITDDLRDYQPTEMYLVYPRTHGHISDRNTPRL
jgi:hypothetical protein